jgi:hypothetical protein
MNEKIVLNFTDYGIKSECKKDDGETIYKNISVDTLKNILNKNMEYDTGFFNIYGPGHIGVKRYMKYGQKEIIFIEAAPSIREVIYEERKHQIPFPGLIMAVVMKNENQKLKITNTLISLIMHMVEFAGVE